MTNPLVSVIIPNYNYGLYLGQAIESVLAQTYKNVEIIVVDDGSTDNSQQVLANYGDKIKWFKQTNQGVSKARNRGISDSKGEIIAFLDSDDVWLPQKLEKQVHLLLSDSELGLVHCGNQEFDKSGKQLEKRLDGMAGYVAEEMLRWQRPVILGGGSAVIVRRSVFDKVDGFDPNVSPVEDWEFYYRVSKNYKVGFVPEVLMNYRIHGGNNHLNIKRMEKAYFAAYDKVFAAEGHKLSVLRNICYGRIHTILAGSYFASGQYIHFGRHMFMGLWLSPVNIGQFLKYPIRKAKRIYKSRVYNKD